jgi:hypothetical protein
MVATDIAVWASTPDEWAHRQPMIAGALNALSASDRSAVQSWVANKPELPAIAELGSDIADAGQFAFGGMLSNAIWDAIANAGAESDSAVRAALEASRDAGSPSFWTSVGSAAKRIHRNYPALKSLLARGDISKKRGLAIYEDLWAEYEKTKTTKRLASYVSFHDLQALSVAELDRCNAQVRHSHSLHLNQTSGASSSPANSPPLSAGGLAQQIVDHKMPATKNPWRGSEVRYIPGLGGAVESMRLVLDAGDRIIMGVLSGVTGGMTPEHYLYVVGHRGNAFVCTDSDPNNEKPGVLPTKGIRYLYFDPAANRLSSAPTDESFPIDWDPAIREDRFQMDGPHRYQALTIAKLPRRR